MKTPLEKAQDDIGFWSRTAARLQLQLDAATSQNAELLEALQAYVVAQQSGEKYLLDGAHKKAISAIRKAKRG